MTSSAKRGLCFLRYRHITTGPRISATKYHRRSEVIAGPLRRPGRWTWFIPSRARDYLFHVILAGIQAVQFFNWLITIAQALFTGTSTETIWEAPVTAINFPLIPLPESIDSRLLMKAANRWRRHLRSFLICKRLIPNQLLVFC